MKSSDKDKLLDAFERYMERFRWFSAGKAPEEGFEMDVLKLVLAEWDETLEPWRGRITDREYCAAYDNLFAGIVKGRARVRFMCLVAIHKLLEGRIQWLMWEMAMRAPDQMKRSLDGVSPEERERLLALARKTLGKDFDAAEMFQEAMGNADANEAAWNQSFDQFKKEWSDESTPELEARLSSINAPHAAIWMAELLPEMLAIKEKHPELNL